MTSFSRSLQTILRINLDGTAYADLILNGDPKAYLKNVTEYKPLD